MNDDDDDRCCKWELSHFHQVKSHCLHVKKKSTCKKANTNEQSNNICTGIDRLAMSIYQGFSFSFAFVVPVVHPYICMNVVVFFSLLFVQSIGVCYCFDFLAIKISFHICKQIIYNKQDASEISNFQNVSFLKKRTTPLLLQFADQLSFGQTTQLLPNNATFTIFYKNSVHIWKNICEQQKQMKKKRRKINTNE